ncbi:MAG: DUF5678 domain-containing protein [Acidobacteriota bacterium]|nr:DUF5678 domain-containing protein [Acidobacteriota bacterium]
MVTNVLSEVRASSVVVNLEKELEWLREHWREYLGQWVVLDGERLIGHGSDPRPLVAQARAEGVKMPFAKYVRDETLPSMGGWM